MMVPRFFIGVDAGGTKLRAAIADDRGRLLAHLEGPGTNAAVDGPMAAGRRIADVLAPLVRGRPVTGLTIGIAGGWSPAVARRITGPVRAALAPRRLTVVNDAVASLSAYAPNTPALLLSLGTGVVLVGRDPQHPGKTVRVDGWGPLAGDAGSGHWIGRRAAERALASYDGRYAETRFTRAVRAALHLADPGRDIHRLYALSRPQAAVAALTPLALRFARQGDPVARSIVRDAAAALARTVEAGLRRMPPGRVRLLVSGGLAFAAPELLSEIRHLARRHPGRLHLDAQRVVAEEAALRLAVRGSGGAALESRMAVCFEKLDSSRPRQVSSRTSAHGLAVTEQSNPATENFSQWTPLEMAQAMNREDARVAPAIAAILPAVARAITLAELSLRRSGRLIYIGAGTSGRLGVLDASEAPPTFGVSPRTVVGVIAGGRRALARGVEGAEDRADQGAAAIRAARVTEKDCVVGLSVSGGAPFVLAAVALARRRGAATVGITCNPTSRLARAVRVALVPRVGPEAIAGSSRLKAGTAQKMLLNMISTCTFARLGRIDGNLMIRVTPVNAKLKLRAARIVATRLDITPADARLRLIRAGWRMDRVVQRDSR